jgi:predicted DsbA family dithiol-disulfide isomerase
MVEVRAGTIQVWSDIACPWAHVAVWRLHDARRRLGLEDRVQIDHRAFPLELFNSEPTPRHDRGPEWPACAALAPRAGWQSWSAADSAWPVTTLPALEAVQAAKAQGLEASAQLDRGLRRAFWAESRCISLRHVILEVASATDGLDLAALAAAIDDGRARQALFAQYETAKTDAVHGSPHLFVHDGTNAENPGLQVDWAQDESGAWVPTVRGDDPAAYDDLLRRAAG